MLFRKLLLVPLLSALASPALASTPVFINEFHYDNTGPDTGEAVEIVGPALTNLNGWSVVLYNGMGGTAYGTIPLGGILANECNGFGTVVIDATGIQNGAPDGLALVNGTTVVQFLSYEGVFAATNGPAAGLTSVNVGVSENGSGPVGHSLRLAGTGAVAEDFAWQPSAPASFGQCNPGQTFVGGIDSPPVVIDLKPAHGATNVPESAAIDVRFSEPVSLGPGAVTLVCSVSGGVGLTLTANPNASRYVYTPAAPFVSAETCTASVAANLVSDLDGTPDTMTANAVSTFTVATDVAPTVVDRRPLAGAANVPTLSPLRVFFSEPVAVADGWLTLHCTTTGAHAFTTTGGPQRFVVQPVPAFGGNETCTATVHAALVVDQDGSPHAMASDSVWSFGTGPAVGAYYQSAYTTSAAALRASLHAIIKNHTRYPYTSGGTDTWTILEQADEDPNDPHRIVDAYKNVSFAKVPSTRPYNREHIWPKAYGFPDDTATNHPYTDTHMLHLTDNAYNSTRGTKPFGECSAVCDEYPTALTNGEGGGNGVHPGNSNWSDGVIWEVWGARKGDLARALLYMDVRYEGGLNATTNSPEPDLVLTDNLSLIQTTGSNTTGVAYMGLLSVILTWHYADPPSNKERLRNEIVFGYQHNRNPFVDHPEYVDCVFLDLCNDAIFANGFES